MADLPGKCSQVFSVATWRFGRLYETTQMPKNIEPRNDITWVPFERFLISFNESNFILSLILIPDITKIFLLILFFQQIIFQDIKVTICDKALVLSYTNATWLISRCVVESIFPNHVCCSSPYCLSTEAGYPACLPLFFFQYVSNGGSRGVGLDSRFLLRITCKVWSYERKKNLAPSCDFQSQWPKSHFFHAVKK